MLAEDKLIRLTPGSGAEVITQQFEEFRELLWNVIELSADPAPYTLAWNMINLHAQVDLLDFEQGNDGALARVQEKVRQAMELLP